MEHSDKETIQQMRKGYRKGEESYIEGREEVMFSLSPN